MGRPLGKGRLDGRVRYGKSAAGADALQNLAEVRTRVMVVRASWCGLFPLRSLRSLLWCGAFHAALIPAVSGPERAMSGRVGPAAPKIQAGPRIASPHFLSEAQQQRLLASFDPEIPRGARVSEIAALNRQDIQLQPARVVQLQGKGRKQRVVPLWKSTTAHLKGWLVQYLELDLARKAQCLKKLSSPKTQSPRFKPSDHLLK